MHVLFNRIGYWIGGTFALLGFFLFLVIVVTSPVWVGYLVNQGLYVLFFDESYLVYHTIIRFSDGGTFVGRKLDLIDFASGLAGFTVLIGLNALPGLNWKRKFKSCST